MMPSKVDIVADRGGPKYYEAVVRELVSCLIKHDDFRKYLSFKKSGPSFTSRDA